MGQMDIKSNSLCVHGHVCVFLGSTAIDLSWLGSRHSSNRYLATLTQRKFGQLKINFAEKGCKVEKGEVELSRELCDDTGEQRGRTKAKRP